MFRAEDRYCLSLDPFSSPGRSDYLAHFTSTVTEATIYCSGRYARRDPVRAEIHNPFCYPLDQILLMYALSQRGGGLIHASGVNLDGRGYIFAGRSGAGKSTLSRLLAASGCGTVLSDDRVALRAVGDGYQVYGTPWAGTEGIAVNERLPLHGIVFIQHGGENRLRPLEPKDIVRRLMPVTSVPWYDAPVMTQVLDFLDGLARGVKGYEFQFRPESSAVRIMEEAFR